MADILTDILGNATVNAGSISGQVPIANGGTGSSTADGAKVNLGLPSSAWPGAVYLNTNFYPCIPNLTTISSNANGAANNAIYAHPMIITERVTVTALYIRTDSDSAGSSSAAKGGIYSMGSDKKPATLLRGANGGTATTGSNSAYVLTLDSNLTLDPGIYWAATMHSVPGTAPQFINANGQNTLGQYLGYTSNVGQLLNSNAVIGYSGTGTYASGMPTSFGTATQIGSQATSPMPVCMFGIA